MFVVILGLIIFACVLLILIVLVQNSKGGGLSSNFSSSNQFMGVRKTTDFLEKATWTLAGSLLVLCIAGTLMMSRGGNKEIKSKAGVEVFNPDANYSVPKSNQQNQTKTTAPQGGTQQKTQNK